jgi:hypothetical protein
MTMPLDELNRKSFNTSTNSTTNFCFNSRNFFKIKKQKVQIEPNTSSSSSSKDLKQCLNDFVQNFSYLSLIKTPKNKDFIFNNLKKETLSKLYDLNVFIRHKLPLTSPLSSSSSSSPKSNSLKSLRELVLSKTNKLKRLNTIFKNKMVYILAFSI